MAGSHLLSVLSIYLISLAGIGTAPPSLCPTGSLLSVDPIDPNQIAQIQNDQAVIEQFRPNPSLPGNPSQPRDPSPPRTDPSLPRDPSLPHNPSQPRNPSLLHNPTNPQQRSVVTLTDNQRQQILRNFPNVFQTEEEYLLTRGSSSVPGEDGQDAPNGRPGGLMRGKQVCKPVAGSQPLILVYQADSQQVVELVQMPGQGLNQWILEESCDDLANSPPAAFTCGTVKRRVLAVFVTLSPPYIFDHAYIVVESCVTIYN